jgi:hypothetical protein
MPVTPREDLVAEAAFVVAGGREGDPDGEVATP